MKILERFETRDRVCQVQIVLRRDGLFQVRVLRWTEEKIDDLGVVARFWTQLPTTKSITDRLDRARSIATETLAQHDRVDAWPC